MPTKRWWDFGLLPAVAMVTILVDQLTKRQVTMLLSPNQTWVPVPALGRWFSVSYIRNTGAAFGLFPNYGLVFMVVAVVVVVAIMVYYWHMPIGQSWIKLSLGLQLGGAVGNLIDRLQYGYVIDFIDLKIWPVFNLADSSIVLGVMLLVFKLLRESSGEEGTVAQESRDTVR